MSKAIIDHRLDMSHPHHPTEKKALTAEEAAGGVGATAEAL